MARQQVKPWPKPYTWRNKRHWLKLWRYYRKHPEVLARIKWAHMHTRMWPNHQVWRDTNPNPRGGTSCFTCKLWPDL